MPVTAAESRISIRTRKLVYALLAFVVLMVLFGPSVAERVLHTLGCSMHPGSSEAGCQGLAILPGRLLAPWLSVVPPVDTMFLLLEQTWLLIAGWLVAIVFSARSDRRPQLPVSSQPLASTVKKQKVITSTADTTYAEQRAEWLSQKQEEQAQQQIADELSFHRRILAETGLWGVLSILYVALLAGLFAFCLALGLPLVGGITAQSLLHALGCADQALMASNPLGGFCGFWTERLEPYQQPWFGALLSPIWLFTQFSDVLLIWLGLIVLLALMFVYRVGWSIAFRNTSPYLKAAALILFSAALLGQLYRMTVDVSQGVESIGSSGLGAGVNVVEAVFLLGAVVVLVVIAGVIGMIVLAIALSRKLAQRRAQADVGEKNP
ncbi:MAG: hypothetical protein CVV16_03890 [Gammaproteobacteria bacterium HGW-Gammaproteobacteria-6]|nr:MAG: hypothetical protein CVV16_03890 [Gammaproteobacteria bacterium HGW-Gammaproteobacteria-6]